MKLIYGKWNTNEIDTFLFVIKKASIEEYQRLRKPFMKLIYGKWYTKEIYNFLFVIKLSGIINEF